MALPSKNIKTNEIAGLDTFYNGGSGSGNFGHAGRPGQRGGSGNGQGKTVAEKKGGDSKKKGEKSKLGFEKTKRDPEGFGLTKTSARYVDWDDKGNYNLELYDRNEELWDGGLIFRPEGSKLRVIDVFTFSRLTGKTFKSADELTDAYKKELREFY